MKLVSKVGGSLYDLPDLGPRLRAWLAGLDAPDRRPPLLAEERMEAELALLTHGVNW